MLRAEAVRDDAVRDRVGIIPDRAERCRQAAVAAHAEGGDFAAAYAEQASLRRCDVACWMETNTSAVATAVDATRVLAAWKLAVDAAPRRGDDRTRAVSIMAPFLRRDQAAALLADVGGLGSDTFAAARAWPSERTISLVKAPRHVRQDTEDENSVWVSLLPRGIGGAPGWVDAITHTRNRRCADGSRVIGAGSSTDIVDGSIVAEFVESIVVVRPPPPPPPPPPHSGARRVRIVTRECTAAPRRQPQVHRSAEGGRRLGATAAAGAIGAGVRAARDAQGKPASLSATAGTAASRRSLSQAMCKLYDVQADSDCRMSVQTCEDLFNPVKGTLRNHGYDEAQHCMW